MITSQIQETRKQPPIWRTRAFIISVITGALLLAGALVVNYFAAIYANDRASSAVADIILSNIPVFDVDGFFIWGPVVFWAIMIGIAFSDAKKIPFSLKSIALFVFIRSIFITLTHIGPYPDRDIIDAATTPILSHITSNPNFFIFSSGADLFFSSHTGLPFLMALIYWKDTAVRYFCIFCSIFFAIVVLLGHLHYSIDVASAFFITYTIYHLAEKFFPKDRRMFDGGVIHTAEGS